MRGRRPGSVMYRYEQQCPVCHKAFHAANPAKYCSSACRQYAYRERRRRRD